MSYYMTILRPVTVTRLQLWNGATGGIDLNGLIYHISYGSLLVREKKTFGNGYRLHAKRARIQVRVSIPSSAPCLSIRTSRYFTGLAHILSALESTTSSVQTSHPGLWYSPFCSRLGWNSVLSLSGIWRLQCACQKTFRLSAR